MENIHFGLGSHPFCHQIVRSMFAFWSTLIYVMCIHSNMSMVSAISHMLLRYFFGPKFHFKWSYFFFFVTMRSWKFYFGRSGYGNTCYSQIPSSLADVLVCVILLKCDIQHGLCARGVRSLLEWLRPWTSLWIVSPAGLLHDTEWSPPVTNYICLCLYLLDNLAPGTAEKEDSKTACLIDVSRIISKSK